MNNEALHFETVFAPPVDVSRYAGRGTLRKGGGRVTLLMLVVLLANGAPGMEDWVFEQVDGDTVDITLGVAAKVGVDGVIHVGYGASNSTFYHAWKDSAWHRETAVPAPISGMFRIAVGRHGEVGVLFFVTGRDGRTHLAEKRDSAWSVDTVPLNCSGRGFCLAYDTAGVPCLALGSDNYVQYAERRDTAWTSTVLANFTYPYGWPQGPVDLVFDSSNYPHTCWRGVWDYHNRSEWIDRAYRNDAGEWVSTRVASSDDSSALLAFDVRDAEHIAVCYNMHGVFYYNNEVVSQPGVAWARVRLDSAARPHVVIPMGTAVEHRYKYDGRWYCDTVMTATGLATIPSLCYSPRNELVLAFARDWSPWIARRELPHVSVAERPSYPASTRRASDAAPTVVNGVLFLPNDGERGMAGSELLGICGQKVMELQFGPNDVSRLAPGVYFFRYEGPNVRRVIVTR